MRVPWFVRRSWDATRTAYARRKPAWEGIYTSFESIPYDGWFGGDEWRDKASAAVRMARAESKHLIPSSLSLSKAKLAAIASAIDAPGSLRILDFGGAAGADFANLLNCLGQDADITYVVVDGESLCEAGRDLWKFDPRISFRTTPPAKGEFDIVYSCSALQYVEDYRALLATFASYNPKAMYFIRHCFTQTTFARKQVNRGAMPEWAFGVDEFCDIMKSLNYRVTMKTYSEDDFNSDNYDPTLRIERSTNLLFINER